MTDEIECRDCDGEGSVEHRFLSNYVSPQAECPPDPVRVECEACNGKGWREPTEEDADALAEAAYDRQFEGEPPMSFGERTAMQSKRDAQWGVK